MRFQIDFLACLLLLVWIGIVYCLKKIRLTQPISSFWSFSITKNLKMDSWKIKYANLPQLCHSIAFIAFMLAFIDPYLSTNELKNFNENQSGSSTTIEGIALYLVLDQSSSMAQVIKDDSATSKMSKETMLKQISKKFIFAHPNDLIGLISFARVPKVLVPLTLDQQALIDQIDQLKIVSKKEEDGTAMGYAIFKAVNILSTTKHFSEDKEASVSLPYIIKSAAIIVVTDGFQDPNYLDRGNRLRTLELDEAAQAAKQKNIHLYFINVDPTFESADFAPHRRQLQQLTEETGGGFYMSKNPQELDTIYAKISELEKGKILSRNQEESNDKTVTYRRYLSFYPYLIGIGMCFLLLALLLDYLVIRRVS